MVNDAQPISKDYFVKRLVTLCLRSGLTGFPKDDADQHILLKSAMIAFDPARVYTEQEINEKLKSWVDQVSQIPGIDHGTLRRRLVDTGYLTRSKDGSAYQISSPSPGMPSFEAAIDEIDAVEVIHAAREEIAQRKRAYLEKSRSAKG